MRTCDYHDCTRRHMARGYCSSHYWQLMSGKPLSSTASKRQILPHPSLAGVSVVPLARGKAVALIDSADAELIGKHNWHISPNGTINYASTNVGPRRVRMHKMLRQHWGLGDVILDHQNRDGLDNRRSNLRVATVSQNMANRVISRSKPGLRGVGRRGKRWGAHITANGRRIYLGTTDDSAAAARLYDKAAREHFGEFAVVNFPGGENG